MEATATLHLPPTLNHSYGIANNRIYKTHEAKDWQEAVSWMFKNTPRFTGQVAVEIKLYLKYDRDIDSSLKLILDTLQDMEVYPNDKKITELHIYKFKDTGNPRMELRIDDVSEAQKTKKDQ